MSGFFKILFFVAIMAFYTSSEARGNNDTPMKSIGNLETEFSYVVEQVESQLLDAPEASYLYLLHWIEVYNQAAQGKARHILEAPKVALTPTNPVSISQVKGNWKPNGYPLVSPQWGQRKPMSFEVASQFRPSPPPSTNDPRFQKALTEVSLLGDLHSIVRVPEESLIAAYWANGAGSETPPGRWNLIALENTHHLPRTDRIDIMLRLNIALYDAGIAAWDAKYHYNYWRPQTAIASNLAEQADWEPMMQPPFHPEYVSGHSAFSGAGAEVLEHYLGTTPFCMTVKDMANLERCYESFKEAAEEAGRSRLFGGIHFEFSNQAGLTLGRKIARNVIDGFDEP